jgi:hypothetical protein
MKTTFIAALSIATAATALPLAAIAHADNGGYAFQSPSGNIVCKGDASLAMCQIHDRTYVAPPVSRCEAGGTDPNTFQLDPGKPADFACDYASIYFGPPLQALGYGQTQSAGSITCDSEPSGVTCTDSSTGHFFRVSRDSYQLG